MPAVSNPFVDYLTRYTTASPDHEAAFDEFLSQVRPPPASRSSWRRVSRSSSASALPSRVRHQSS